VYGGVQQFSFAWVGLDWIGLGWIGLDCNYIALVDVLVMLRVVVRNTELQRYHD
jgi:hypothetical protein